MDYLDYLGDGNKISEVRDGNGNKTGGFVLKSPEGQLLSNLSDFIKNLKIKYDWYKLIKKNLPEVPKTSSDNSNGTGSFAVATKLADRELFNN